MVGVEVELVMPRSKFAIVGSSTVADFKVSRIHNTQITKLFL